MLFIDVESEGKNIHNQPFERNAKGEKCIKSRILFFLSFSIQGCQTASNASFQVATLTYSYVAKRERVSEMETKTSLSLRQSKYYFRNSVIIYHSNILLRLNLYRCVVVHTKEE